MLYRIVARITLIVTLKHSNYFNSPLYTFPAVIMKSLPIYSTWVAIESSLYESPALRSSTLALPLRLGGPSDNLE